ncbi:hypothetical protein OHU17_33680 [Streptomyces goshikiensis]|uniref:Uncharacterized protein n=1 Tax=Streptomyces goshikiensis TaxID=1942 RepID=A0ABZ1RX03_9ACTN|nr:hypothetical protein [Streptomyces goshikiensis]
MTTWLLLTVLVTADSCYANVGRMQVLCSIATDRLDVAADELK